MGEGKTSHRAVTVVVFAVVSVVVNMMQKRKTPKYNKIVKPFLFRHKFYWESDKSASTSHASYAKSTK